MPGKNAEIIVVAPFKEFLVEFKPLEANPLLLVDHCTGAKYCECHIAAQMLIKFGTTDVPLDPEDQSEYRANREIVENAPAYEQMLSDAKQGRTFSNIVAEYNKDFDPDHPIKIIGGQHRFQAIRMALEEGINKNHGLKLYFELNTDQRLDVQLISNTNIAISRDLFDRMQETVRGPELRDWCQKVGLLQNGKDFTDRRVGGGIISVQLARTFILNYFAGKSIDSKKFKLIDTSPILSVTGQRDVEWEKLLSENSKIWSDIKLEKAGKEFVRLIDAQRAAFSKQKSKGRVPPDYASKALNMAVVAAWSYVAGVLNGNEIRLSRHYALADAPGKDPLNAAALASGKHKTDPENYRGLGYRTDAKERSRMAELFFLQAEEGKGITKASIDVAIAEYHAKLAILEVEKLKAKA